MKLSVSTFLFRILPALSFLSSGALAAEGGLREIGTNFPCAEPYAPLHGGAFTGPAVPESPDPLQQFRWTAPYEPDELQTYELRPLSVTADPPASFGMPDSATRSECRVKVIGPGSIRFDFGVESAAWLEFDSPDLSGEVEMSISEFNQPPCPAAPGKTMKPVRHGSTYRLELSKELYEGVRFGWIHVRHFERPWQISVVRAVCQIRPVNYRGSFDCSDPLLTRAWHTGAYAVKLNMLRDYIDDILMGRGDRADWSGRATGDAHVSQGTALVAFGNWDFIARNLDRTALPSEINDSICSYPIYWVLSLVEYYRYTGDAAEAQKHLSDAQKKLDHGAELYADPPLGFYGWDDRVGAGVENLDSPEAKNAYRLLFIRACREFAATAQTLGRPELRDRYREMADKLAAQWRTDPHWHERLGIHAAAEAVNAGMTTGREDEYLREHQFGNRVNRISFSPFNEFFLLYAMSRLGQSDEALTAARDCWGGQIAYGGTTFFECYDPSWNAVLRKNDPVPNGRSGYTSLCHPWSSGVTKWLTEEVLGIKPTTPGFATVDIFPHLGSSLTRVSGGIPTPHGVVEAAFDVKSGQCEVTIPPGVISRLGIPTVGRKITAIKINNLPAWDGTYHSQQGMESAEETPDFVRFNGMKSGHYTINVKYSGPRRPVIEQPMEHPVALRKTDATTHGDWGGKYGRDGYVLFSYAGPGKDCVRLPPYIRSVTPLLGKPIRRDATWAQQTDDSRALAPDPANSIPRCASCTHALSDWPNLTLHLDVNMKTNTAYCMALYFLDWDEKGRQTSVEVRDLKTLDVIAPTQIVSEYVNGKYLVYRCDRPVRVRLEQVRGDNAVISGVFFDPAPTK
jgi:hypothetical protein